MKTIGLLGGMTWESSIEYYRIINEAVRDRLGGVHSADSLMYSFDFDVIEKLHDSQNWEKATELMVDAAQRIEKGGADFIVICTNTMHKMADDVEKNVQIPLIHIVDATAEKVKESGLKKVGLLGSKFTMEEDFYKGRLLQKHGIEAVIPDEEDRKTVNDVIYYELSVGKLLPESRENYKKVISRLKDKGAEGVILGCTEIPLLIKQKDTDIPVFDTTTIHALKAVDFALSK